MKKGFTLIELMLVVGALALLILALISYFKGSLLKGMDAKKKSDLYKISVAAEEYEKDHDCYPTLEELQCDPGDGLKPYISQIPCEPYTDGASYEVELGGPSECPTWYRIYTKLRNEADSDIEEKACEYGCGPDYAYNFFISSPNASDPIRATDPGAGGTTVVTQTNLWGCIDYVCRQINWDPSIPGPECQPNFPNSSCSGLCGSDSTECIPVLID